MMNHCQLDAKNTRKEWNQYKNLFKEIFFEKDVLKILAIFLSTKSDKIYKIR